MKLIGSFSEVKSLSVLGVFSLLLSVVACSTTGGQKSTGPSGNATLGEAARDAETVAAQEAGRQAVQGSGDSMAPVLGEKTLLVVHPIRYEDLEIGMSVAYRDSQGRRIVHRLFKKTPKGWIARGINNDIEDEELVTRENLLGVVYATFLFSDEEAPKKSGQ